MQGLERRETAGKGDFSMDGLEPIIGEHEIGRAAAANPQRTGGADGLDRTLVQARQDNEGQG